MMAFGALMMRVSRATIPRLVILLMTQKRHSRASFIHKIGREASINPSLVLLRWIFKRSSLLFDDDGEQLCHQKGQTLKRSSHTLFIYIHKLRFKLHLQEFGFDPISCIRSNPVVL
jgi:hypothetical protein